MNLKSVTTDGLLFLQFPHLTTFAGLSHAVTTRRGGISAGPFSSLNLGLNTGDVSRVVRQNRRKVLSTFGWKPESLLSPLQKHGNSVVTVTQAFGTGGIGDTDLGLGGCDGLLTRDKGLVLMIKVADCFPVFLYDPVEKAIGLIHAGWRGTASGIITRAIEAMALSFRSEPKHIAAGIGPGIGSCCFVVGEDVWKAFEKHHRSNAFRHTNDDARFHCDLKKIIATELLACGLREERVKTADACTYCDEARFYSHRRDNGKTGRMAALIGLRG